MITIRAANERGYANHGWLNSHHTFSFGEYYDPNHMGFGALRVINEDRVAPGQGFDMHGHRDMEIFSYVVNGELAHKDSMGNSATVRPGDIQIMSAGTGVRLSEFNGSKTEPVHFLQIWITPKQSSLMPRYDEAHFSVKDKLNQLRLILSPDARNGSVAIHQDANIYASILEKGSSIEYKPNKERRTWLQVISGILELNGVSVKAGDGVAIINEDLLSMKATAASEFLLFDLQ